MPWRFFRELKKGVPSEVARGLPHVSLQPGQPAKAQAL